MELLIDFASEEVEDDASEQDHDPRVHIAALALGLIYVGTGEDEGAQPMIERLLQCSDAELSKPETRLYMVGLALIYLGCEEGADVARDILSTLSNKAFKDFALITLNACAYAGSGSVLKVQEMLHACAEHIQEQDKSFHQASAVLGIAMITMGEEVGSNMAMRTMEHLLQYVSYRSTHFSCEMYEHNTHTHTTDTVRFRFEELYHSRCHCSTCPIRTTV